MQGQPLFVGLLVPKRPTRTITSDSRNQAADVAICCMSLLARFPALAAAAAIKNSVQLMKAREPVFDSLLANAGGWLTTTYVGRRMLGIS